MPQDFGTMSVDDKTTFLNKALGQNYIAEIVDRGKEGLDGWKIASRENRPGDDMFRPLFPFARLSNDFDKFEIFLVGSPEDEALYKIMAVLVAAIESELNIHPEFTDHSYIVIRSKQ
jgi:hypothetical protein